MTPSVLLWPARFLTKIWTVSAASEDIEDKEEMDEEREERMMVVVGRSEVGRVRNRCTKI